MDMIRHTEKISSRHSLPFRTFTVTLTLNAVIPFFPQDTQAYDAIKFGCKGASTLKDTTEIVIF